MFDDKAWIFHDQRSDRVRFRKARGLISEFEVFKNFLHIR
jgi:hypothetical protein